MRHIIVALLMLAVLPGCTDSADTPVQLAQAGDTPVNSPDADLLLRVIADPSDMQISPDGGTLTVVDRGRYLQRWRTSDATLIDIRELDAIASLASGGNHALIFTSGGADVVEVASGEELGRVETYAAGARPEFVSPDGKFVFGSGSGAFEPLLHDIASDERSTIARAESDSRSAYSTAVHFADDRRVLVGYADGSVRIWDFEAEEQIVLRESPEHYTPPGFSSRWPPPDPHVSDVDLRDGLAAAVGPYTGCFVWDAETGELVAQPTTEEMGASVRPRRVALSPDGAAVAFAGSDDIRVWDFEREEATRLTGISPELPTDADQRETPTISEVPWYDLGRQPPHVFDLRYTDDGTLMAAGSYWGQAWFWRGSDDTAPRGICPTPFYQQAVPIAARATAEDGLVVWARGLKSSAEFGGRPERVWLNVEDDGMRRVLRWETNYLAPDGQTTKFPLSGGTVEVLPEPRIIRTSGGLQQGLWNADDGEPILMPEESPSDLPMASVFPVTSRLSATADGKLIATRDNRTVQLISLPDGDVVRTFRFDEENMREPGKVAISADGSRLAVYCGPLIVFDTASGEEVAREDFGPGLLAPYDFALSPSGDRLAFAETHLRLYDAATLEPIEAYDPGNTDPLGDTERRNGAAIDLKFSPDGATVAQLCTDGAIVLYDGRSGEHRATVRPHGRLAYCSSWTMWARRPGVYQRLPIRSAAFDEAGDLLASVGDDGTVAVTDVQRGEVLVTLMWVGGPGVPDGGWIAWTPDGRYDGTDEAVEACVRFREGDEILAASRFPDLRVEGLIDEVLGR